MATLELQGFEDLEDAFRRISEIPFDVTAEALHGMAEGAMDKIKKASKAKKTETGGYLNISFSGSRKRGKTTTRNAEIAFVNEYGKRGQPARPFIGTAMSRSADEITAPAEKVIGDWIENEFTRE